MKRASKKTHPYGVCECSGGLIGLGCCGGTGPAAFSVVRDGKRIRVCTRCDLSRDEDKRLLVKKTDMAEPFQSFDALGFFCILGKLSEED